MTQVQQTVAQVGEMIVAQDYQGARRAALSFLESADAAACAEMRAAARPASDAAQAAYSAVVLRSRTERGLDDEMAAANAAMDLWMMLWGTAAKRASKAGL